MFFTMEWLCPKRHGKFALPWIAATRGINKLTKHQILTVNIDNICNELHEFIVSNSAVPRNRFSLSLSIKLINGTVKIYNKQISILQDDIVHCICAIYDHGLQERLDELNESSVKAPAPVEKRKRKRQDKAAPKAKRTVTTAEEIEEEAAAIETTDTRAHPELITLREEIGSGPPPELDDKFSFGVMTLEEVMELEHGLLGLTGHSHPTDPHQAGTESNVLRETEKIKEIEQVVEKEKEPDIQMEIVQIPEEPEKVPEEPEKLPEEAARVPEGPEKAPEEPANIPVAKPPSATGAVRKQRNVVQDINKILLVQRNPRRTARIDGCYGYTQMLKNINKTQEVPLREIDATAVSKDNILKGLFARLEKGKNNLMDLVDEFQLSPNMRSSLMSKLSMHRGSELASKQDAAIEVDVQKEIEIIAPLTEHGKHFEHFEEQGLPYPVQQIPIIRPVTPDITIEQTLPPAAFVREKTTSRPVLSNVAPNVERERQEKIIDIIKNWNFDERFPTIEDVCIGKISRLNIARAFTDLLTLSKMKYVVLKNVPNSLELQYIEKGEKLL